MGVRFSALSAGRFHTCGIVEDTGEVACWGLGSDPNADEDGEDDEGKVDYDQSTPPSDVRFLAVSAGDFHTCGIREDIGEVACWGNDNEEQSTPPLGVRFLSVSAGRLRTCGIRENGRVVCWGQGSDPNAF